MIKIENDLFDEWLMVGRMGMTQPFIGLVLESYEYDFSIQLGLILKFRISIYMIVYVYICFCAYVNYACE